MFDYVRLVVTHWIFKHVINQFEYIDDENHEIRIKVLVLNV